MEIDDFVDYHDAWDYSREIDAVIDPIEELSKDGHAEGVIDLTEYALEAVEQAIEHVETPMAAWATR